MSRFALSASCLSILMVLPGCDAGGTPNRRDTGADAMSGGADTDGDGISDVDEGVATDRDTDGDGEPDYLDNDSDGDGIADALEAGDDNTATPPVDSDGDGTPDFVDTDADGNGILDRDEREGDVDGDGVANFQDRDDDGDGLRDERELGGGEVDTDGDGAADYQDPDSDNDTILDGHEANADTDADGNDDLHDLDSDDDGLSDAMEAGDADLATQPIDSDGDGIADFRDVDSDNDGLSDTAEFLDHHTDPRNEDSDGDGVSDLIEIAGGTDPTDGTDSPRTRGDFVFVVPYMEPPSPDRDTLVFRTSIQFADIYFLFDASGSMSGEQDNLAASVTTIMGNLTCADTGAACVGDPDCTGGNICSPFSGTCISDPATSSCVASPWSGTGHYGQLHPTGNHLFNLRSLQPDPALTRASIDTIPDDGGTEPMFSAIAAVCDPALPPNLPTTGCTGPGSGVVGCPSFREEAVKILVLFSDEPHDITHPGTVAHAVAALTGNNITLIGVYSSTAARGDMTAAAMGSGSIDRSGAPLVFQANADGTGIDTVVTDAINEIVEGVPLEVTIDAVDVAGDAGDALQFILALEANTTGDGCTDLPTEDRDGDTYHETYPAVTPGLPVCFDVVPRQNDTVMPATVPLVFEAQLTVYGDGSPLDTRRVFFLVPPEIEGPGGPD